MGDYTDSCGWHNSFIWTRSTHMCDTTQSYAQRSRRGRKRMCCLALSRTHPLCLQTYMYMLDVHVKYTLPCSQYSVALVFFFPHLLEKMRASERDRRERVRGGRVRGGGGTRGKIRSGGVGVFARAKERRANSKTDENKSAHKRKEPSVDVRVGEHCT